MYEKKNKALVFWCLFLQVKNILFYLKKTADIYLQFSYRQLV